MSRKGTVLAVFLVSSIVFAGPPKALEQHHLLFKDEEAFHRLDFLALDWSNSKSNYGLKMFFDHDEKAVQFSITKTRTSPRGTISRECLTINDPSQLPESKKEYQIIRNYLLRSSIGIAEPASELAQLYGPNDKLILDFNFEKKAEYAIGHAGTAKVPYLGGDATEELFVHIGILLKRCLDPELFRNGNPASSF